MKSFKIFTLLFVLLFSSAFVHANESRDGFVRLLINERNGSFQLFYLTDAENYKPLFYNSDPTTSYLSVKVDGRVHRLGSSRAFSTRIERIDRNPAIIYESSFIIVRVLFSPVRTISSPNANGIKVAVEIENLTEEDLSVGLRFLLDTNLGEQRGMIPFMLGETSISRETVVRGTSGQRYWLSGNTEISLMGNILNIFDDNSKTPDYLHFANWKKLNDVPWNAPIREGFTFNHLPYSLNDSAVCYFWEPETLKSGTSFNYTVYLTTEDTAWYTWAPPPAPTINIAEIEHIAEMEAVDSGEDRDLITLQILQDIIQRFIAGEIFLNEQDLLEIERSINRLQFNN